MTVTESSQPQEKAPLAARVLSSDSLGNAGSSESERNTKSKQESSSLAQEKIIVVPEVLSLALPLDGETRSIAAEATHSVTQLLQTLMSLPEQGSNTPDPLLEFVSLSDDAYVRLQSLAQALKPWVDSDAHRAREESTIYSYFQKLVLFVMECLKAHPDWETTPKDSLENFKLDQALFIRKWSDEIGDGVDKPRYADMLAVVEIKVDDSPKANSKADSKAGSKTGSKSGSMTSLSASGVRLKSNIGVAHGQLIRYIRQIYEHQHNRLFAWGASSCGSLVRVYLFGPDCALSTNDLDMKTPTGRKQFIGWLVNICLGEDVRRGFIPSMRYVDGTAADGNDGYWELSVPTLDSNGVGTDTSIVYYSKQPSVVAGSVFGRHTRGFPASATLDNIDKPDVFVKVAWQYTNLEPNMD